MTTKERIVAVISSILSDRYGVRIEVTWQKSEE